MNAPPPALTSDREAWSAAWSRVSSAPWEPPATRVVAVIPHPDDEVLGCGGLLARQHAAGLDVVVVAVTDGEAARGGADRDLAGLRREEQGAALEALGVAADGVVRLGLPDSAVGEHADELVAVLLPLVGAADLVVAPWVGDGHPDHVACGVAARTVSHLIGCELVGSLVWLPLWGPPPTPVEQPLLRLDLAPHEQSARSSAMRCHRSQTDAAFGDPVVDDELLVMLARPFEQYVPTDTGARRGT